MTMQDRTGFKGWRWWFSLCLTQAYARETNRCTIRVQAGFRSAGGTFGHVAAPNV